MRKLIITTAVIMISALGIHAQETVNMGTLPAAVAAKDADRYLIIQDGNTRLITYGLFKQNLSDSISWLYANKLEIADLQTARDSIAWLNTNKVGTIPFQTIRDSVKWLDDNKANLASPTFTGTSTFEKIKIGTAGVVLDSIKSSNDTIYFWSGAKRLHVLGEGGGGNGGGTPTDTTFLRADINTLFSDKADVDDPTFTTKITTPQLVVTGGVPVEAAVRFDSIHFEPGDVIDIDDVALDLEDYAVLLEDVYPLYTFGGGGGNAGDTLCFTTLSFYGNFRNTSEFTMVITSVHGYIMGIGASVAYNVHWASALGGGSPTKLYASDRTLALAGSGNEVTTFTNDEIAPGAVVWCVTPTVTKEPTYLCIQISGYLRRD